MARSAIRRHREAQQRTLLDRITRAQPGGATIDEGESGTLEKFGVAYLFVAPVEVGLVAVAPPLVFAGYGWPLAVLTAAGGLVLLAALARRPGDEALDPDFEGGIG